MFQKVSFSSALRENFLNHGKSNEFWIVITHFPIDSAPNGIPFGAKSIGKLYHVHVNRMFAGSLAMIRFVFNFQRLYDDI